MLPLLLLLSPFSFPAANAGDLAPPPNAPSAAAMQCLFRLQSGLDESNNHLEAAYRAIDPKGGALPDVKRAYGIPPATAEHEDEGVLLLHGFSASPNETKPVGVAVSAAGYPVVLGLLPGFGSSTKVANAYTKGDWENSVASYVNLMSLCFRKIHLIGFSIGGGLLSRYLVAGPGMSPSGLVHAEHGDIQILSAALLAPYFGTGSELTDWLASQIHKTLGLEGIPIQTLYSAFLWLNLKNPVNDLKALALYPSNFNSELPLGAAEQVKQLGEELRAIGPDHRTSVPVFFSYSESDKTIDQNEARLFLKKHFAAYDEQRNLLVFPRRENVPHQIQLPAWNPELSRLLAEITAHLRASGER